MLTHFGVFLHESLTAMGKPPDVKEASLEPNLMQRCNKQPLLRIGNSTIYLHQEWQNGPVIQNDPITPDANMQKNDLPLVEEVNHGVMRQTSVDSFD